MAGETTKRRWYLVVRRDGHAVKKIPVNITLVRDGSDIDGFAAQSQISPDYDIIDSLEDVDDGDGLVASYELVSTTTAFDINYLE